jgi:hypothetical protein
LRCWAAAEPRLRLAQAGAGLLAGELRALEILRRRDVRAMELRRAPEIELRDGQRGPRGCHPGFGVGDVRLRERRVEARKDLSAAHGGAALGADLDQRLGRWCATTSTSVRSTVPTRTSPSSGPTTRHERRWPPAAGGASWAGGHRLHGSRTLQGTCPGASTPLPRTPRRGFSRCRTRRRSPASESGDVSAWRRPRFGWHGLLLRERTGSSAVRVIGARHVRVESVEDVGIRNERPIRGGA